METLIREGAIAALDSPEARREMITRFIGALFGGYEHGFIEMRCFKKAAPVHVYWFRLGTAGGLETDTLIECALREDANGYDVYVGVLPRREHGNGTKGGTFEARWLWIDADFKNGPQADCLSALQGNGCDMIVESGHGYHGYIRLVAPVPLAGGYVTQFEKRLRAWQTRIDPRCDPTHDAPRVLRLPGTHNHKDPANPIPVRLIHLEGV